MSDPVHWQRVIGHLCYLNSSLADCDDEVEAPRTRECCKVGTLNRSVACHMTWLLIGQDLGAPQAIRYWFAAVV